MYNYYKAVQGYFAFAETSKMINPLRLAVMNSKMTNGSFSIHNS